MARMQETSRQLESQMTARSEQWQETKGHLEADISALLVEIETIKQQKAQQASQLER